MAKRFYIEQYSAAESNAKYVVEIHDPLHGQSVVKYGLLYNLYAVIDERNLANTGWHIAGYSDYDALVIYLGDENIGFADTSGGKLKETGLTYWNTPNSNAVNSVGFNLRGAGSRSGGGLAGLKNTAVMVLPEGILLIASYNNQTFLYGDTFGSEEYGRSIRVVKDSTLLTHGQTGTYTGNDGKVYRTICIDGVEWLADNLAETKFRNGDWIPGFDGGVYTPISNSAWATLTTAALCAYNDDLDNAFETVDGDATQLDGSFMLRYDEGKVSDLLFPLLSSVAEITVNVTEADTLFEDFIEELPLRNEEDLLVKIYREDVQIWMGQIPTDLVEYPDQYYTYQVSISAVCGLSRLKNIKYDDAGTPFEGRNTILGHFLNCLTKLNYPSSLNTLPILKVIGFKWEEDNMLLSANSHLENIDLAFDCFQQYDYFDKIESMNCYAVLEQMCRTFNLRLFMCGDVFCLQQIQEGNNADAYTYSGNGTLLDTEELDVTRSFDLERTDGNFSNYPPVRDISLIYNYKQGINRGNLLPADFALGTLIVISGVTGGAGEIMLINIQGAITVDNVDFMQWYARYSILLRIGDKWLTGERDVSGTVTASWSDTLAYFTIETTPEGVNGYHPFDINVFTPAIPAGGTCYYQIDYAGIFLFNLAPGGTGTASATFRSAALSQIVEAVDESSGLVKFTATNTTDGSTPISSNVSEELPDTLIGDGQRIYSAGRLRVFHGGSVWSNSDAWAAYNGGTAMNINKLRLQETLCIKKSVIKTFDFTLQVFAWMYEALMFKSADKLFMLGYELDPELDSVNVQTVFVNFDRTNILINSELDAPDEASGGTGNGGGSSADTHNRLHDVISTLDHSAAVGSDKGKLLGNNASTGLPEWVAKLWKRVGTVLSPETDGDELQVDLARIGSSTDNVTISATGHLKLNGSATVFDDLFVPLTTTRQGSNNKPDFDYTNIGYLFPQNDATEILYLIVQMPHRWKAGSDIFPHVHYNRTSAGKPTFKIDYSWFNIGSAVAAPGTTLPLATEVITYTSGSIHQINQSTAAISGSGKTMSSILLIKLYRDDNTVSGDVLTYQFDLHFEIDSLGSNSEYQKD